jgi:GntR family transcriptional regulator, rspAB operon transcriptional repressor
MPGFPVAVQNCYISMQLMNRLLEPTRLNRKLPMRDQIYVMVRQLIITGSISPGEVIDEKMIASRLGISRTPVREAVKKLTDEHLVDVVAQSATRAARIDRHEVEQAFLIRRALEMESAAQAASRMTKKHTEALMKILAAHARAISRRRIGDAIRQDDNFHRFIAEISNLPRLWRAIEISKGQLDRCRHLMLPRKGEGDATLAQHRAVVRALESRNPERARAAMAKHLEAAYGSAVKAMDAGEIEVAGEGITRSAAAQLAAHP